MARRGRILTPMELAGKGLDLAGKSLEAMYGAAKEVLPVAVEQGTRGIDQLERLASSAEKAVELAERLAGPAGPTTVVSVVSVDKYCCQQCGWIERDDGDYEEGLDGKVCRHCGVGSMRIIEEG